MEPEYLTPQEVADKYTNEDGEVIIPENVLIVMPRRTSAIGSIAKATVSKGIKSKL